MIAQFNWLFPGLAPLIDLRPRALDAVRAAFRGTLRSQAKSMAYYRCYFLDTRDHIISYVTIDLPTDTLACVEADGLWKASPHHGIELWSGTQRILREVAVP